MGYPNLLLFPEAFDNAAWAKFAATVTANATTDPFGGTAADKLVEDGTTASRGMLQTVTRGTVAARQTYSIYLKSGERTTAVLLLTDGTGFASLNANLATGAVTSSSLSGTGLTDLNAGVIAAGGGWHRYYITATLPAATTLSQTYVYPNTNASYLGDGTSGIYVFGARLELFGPGSYITPRRNKTQVPARILFRALRRMKRAR